MINPANNPQKDANAAFLESLETPQNKPVTFAQRVSNVTQYGIPVMPLKPQTKDAFLKNWPDRVTLDANQIARWEKQNPAFNYAAVGQTDGFWILDVDDGDLLEQIVRETGHTVNSIDTLIVRSSGAKRHVYFKHDPRSEVIGNRNYPSDPDAKEIFSVRAHNKYVVGPGSIHPDTGEPYETLHKPSTGVIPAAPAWLMDWIEKQISRPQASAGTATQSEETAVIPEGGRDKWLFKQACDLRDSGLAKQVVLDALTGMNLRQCVPPMSNDVVAAKVNSAFTRPSRKTFAATNATSDSAYGVPPAHVESNEPEPVAAEVHTIRVPDMDEKVLVGRLGEIYDKYMRKDFPISYAWLALVTAAGMIVPSGDHIRTNFYSALVGGVHVGKSQCIEWVLRMLGLTPPILMRVNAGSGEALSIGRLSKADGQSRLLFVDELSHLLAKSQIEGASFPFLLNQAYYQRSFEILASRGREVLIHCNLSIIGGVVEQSFDTAFGAASVGGLYDRFALAQAPSGYQFDYRPCPHEQVLSMDPADVTVDPQVWEAKSELVKKLDVNPRVFEIGLKVAAVCAAVDGRSVLTAADLEPVIPFVVYQSDARKVLQPNAGENVDGILASKFLNYIERHGAHGEWLEVRTLLRHTRAYDFGVGYQRVLDGLERGGEIDQHGRGVKGQKHLVRRSAVSKSDEGVQK